MAALAILPGSISLDAAVILQTFATPLAPNTHGFIGDGGPGYRVENVSYRFWWLPAPAALDLDSNHVADIIFSGTDRGPSEGFYVTLNGSNQVWARAGGAAGLDFGTYAVALAGGVVIGPALTSADPQIGWHNDDDTRGFSVLMQAVSGRPVDGEFLPAFPFEQKYLGLRFSRDGATHYGWISISGYAMLGQEVYIHQWAYESEAETGLIVGRVPEPGVPSLVVAGSVIVGLCRRRRVAASGRRGEW